MTLEVSLVKAFGWSLRDIDETDIESLLMFVFQVSGSGSTTVKQAYCDQVDWL